MIVSFCSVVHRLRRTSPVNNSTCRYSLDISLSSSLCLSLSAYADMSGRNGGQFRDHSFAQDLNASTDAATSSLGQLLIIVVAPTMFIFWQGLDLFQWTMAVGMTLVVLA